MHVQETAGNSREDEIFKSKRTHWKSLYEMYLRAWSKYQSSAIGHADCGLRLRHYKPRIFKVSFI